MKHSNFFRTVKLSSVNFAEGDGISQLLLEKGWFYLSRITVRAVSKQEQAASIFSSLSLNLALDQLQ